MGFMVDTPDDRREHSRAPIELKVEYKKMNTFFADYTKNISKGGTFIKTQKPLKVGTEFLFKLVIPALDKPIEIHGRVMWVNGPEIRERPEVEDSGMGIKFLYEGDAQRNEFESFVEGLMAESLGTHLMQKLINKKP
jgi:type IV pilus assembly protein PilZ